MSRLNPVWSFINHNRYWIVTIVGCLLVGVLGENSFMERVKYEMQIRDLKEQIAEYTGQYEHDEALLRELRTNPDAITRIARERYLMKADDEDIFVLSDDVKPNVNKDETVK